MVAVLTLLSVVAISIIIVRVATKALQLTGLPAEAARFQAYSAFSGTGFTTEEAEDIRAKHAHERELSLQDIEDAARESPRPRRSEKESARAEQVKPAESERS